jgi:hypothetical protein
VIYIKKNETNFVSLTLREADFYYFVFYNPYSKETKEIQLPLILSNEREKIFQLIDGVDVDLRVGSWEYTVNELKGIMIVE